MTGAWAASSLLLLLLLLTACAGRGTVPTQAEKLADLSVITQKCKLPRETLRLVGANQLYILPPLNAKVEQVDCLLSELKRLRYPLDMGFVGNEAPSPEAQ